MLKIKHNTAITSASQARKVMRKTRDMACMIMDRNKIDAEKIVVAENISRPMIRLERFEKKHLGLAKLNVYIDGKTQYLTIPELCEKFN